jgi:hypothetical protein
LAGRSSTSSARLRDGSIDIGPPPRIYSIMHEGKSSRLLVEPTRAKE